MKKLILKLYNNPIVSRIFPTVVFCLKRELVDCKTVLDLGCGPDSPIRHCKNIDYSVGVEVFEPYLNKSKAKKIHSKYYKRDILKLDFPENSFDAVILIEVLEHLPKDKGRRIISLAKKWAKRKLIVTSPNGFVKQKAIDNNPWQKHLSGWDYREMRSLGFKCWGLAGLKHLRQEVENDTMGDDLMSSIRLKPRVFWFIIASLSQLIVYWFPELAFELFSVKYKK